MTDPTPNIVVCDGDQRINLRWLMPVRRTWRQWLAHRLIVLAARIGGFDAERVNESFQFIPGVGMTTGIQPPSTETGES